MLFAETPIAGAWLVRPEARQDDRGFFERVWCRDEFAAHGLRADFVQCNRSGSRNTRPSFSTHRPPLQSPLPSMMRVGEVATRSPSLVKSMNRT